jgi:hypothetical protein
MAFSKLDLNLLIVTDADALDAIQKSVTEQCCIDQYEWRSKQIGCSGFRLTSAESVQLKLEEKMVVSIGIAALNSGGREELSSLLQAVEQSINVLGLLVYFGLCFSREPSCIGDIKVPQRFYGLYHSSRHLQNMRTAVQPMLQIEEVHRSIKQGFMYMKRDDILHVPIPENWRVPDKFRSRRQKNTAEINLLTDCHFSGSSLSLTREQQKSICSDERPGWITERYPDVDSVDTNSFAFVSEAKKVFKNPRYFAIQMVAGLLDRDHRLPFRNGTAACAVAVLLDFLQQCSDLVCSSAQCRSSGEFQAMPKLPTPIQETDDHVRRPIEETHIQGTPLDHDNSCRTNFHLPVTCFPEQPLLHGESMVSQKMTHLRLVDFVYLRPTPCKFREVKNAN